MDDRYRREKFAHLRGARIEFRISQGRWNVVNPKWLNDARAHYRVHPDDEHLQYGPVSTALRDMAMYPTEYDDSLPEIVKLFEDWAGEHWHFTDGRTAVRDNEDQLLIDWTRLFFAEWFADEGL